MNINELLTSLSEASGVSGYESERAEIVRGAFAEYADEVRTDTLGNVIGLKKGRGEGKLMLAAHMDEVGLMVSDIDEKGFVGFTTIGGIDTRVLVAQEVMIHGKVKIYGVIGLKPPHLTSSEDRKAAPKLEDLRIDIGCTAKRAREFVRVGDIATFYAETRELKNGSISGKSIDDSAGVAALYSALKYLKDINHDLNVYVTATVLEETGRVSGGAVTSAYGIEPDVAIAVDVGFAKTPELDDLKTIEAGGGPAIAIGPRIHPRVYEILKRVAKESNIKHQFEVLPLWTGTDTDDIQISGTGVATGLLSIPLKYMHTAIETVLPDDVDQTGRLIAEFVRSFNGTGLEDALCL